MSDRTTSVPATQEQAVTPQQVTTPAAEAQPESQTDSQPATPAVTLEQCNRTLAAFGKAAASQTEVCYQLGALGMEYVRQCLAASEKAERAAATERLASELWQHGEDSLSTTWAKCRSRYLDRVSVLLGCQAVVELLGDGKGVAKGDGTGKGRGTGKKDSRLAWGKLREFRPLVTRCEGREERWEVVPHVGDEAKALLAEVATAGLSREDVAANVAKVVALSAARTADAKLEAAKAQEQAERLAHQAAVRAAQERDAAAAKVATVATAVEQAEAALANAADEAARETARAEAAVAVGNMEAARAELEAAEKAKADAAEATAKAAADKARADAEAQHAAKLQAEADAKAAAKEQAAEQRKGKGEGKGEKTATVSPPADDDKGGPEGDTRPEPKHGNLMGGLAKLAKHGTPKDVAGGMADAIRAAEDPYALLYELVLSLADDTALAVCLDAFDAARGKLGDKATRAVKGARLAMTVSRQTVPAEPSSNGHKTAAVA